MSRAAAARFGAAAGAAGTTALNAVTYLDMAIRGRPSSSTPEDTVEKLSDTIGVPVPGDEETRRNRLSGLGPLLGAVAGVGAGAALGALLCGRRPGFPLTMTVASGMGMVVGNGPMTVLQITNPAEWSPADWVSDVVPHLAYGAVTAFVLTRGGFGDND
jgi:hypothetical protein